MIDMPGNGCGVRAAAAEGVEVAWLCARTKPKHEHIAAAGLVRRLGLEVFHPRIRLERATQRGVVRVVEPLFPCYVFVRCPVANGLEDVRVHDRGEWGGAVWERVPTVPDGVIEELRQCFEPGDEAWAEDGLCAGAGVTVAEGSFLG